IGSIAYVNIPIAREHEYLIEPILLCFLTALSLLQIAKANPPRTITPFEVCYGAFTLYTIANSMLLHSFDAVAAGQGIVLVVVYFSLRSTGIPKHPSIFSSVLLWIIILLFTSYVLVVLCSDAIRGKAIDTLFLPNKSIFSIYLASHIVFILPFYHYHCKQAYTRKTRVLRWVASLIIVLSVLLLVYTKGRAGWIGCGAAVWYLLYHYIRTSALRKKIFRYAALLVILLAPLVLWYKWDSTQGRMLIYKVSTSILKDHWRCGIGMGQFKVRYNEYQATYFAGKGIDTREALLADNTFYAFNDPYQLFIETGIIGFLCWAMALLCLVQQVKNMKTTSDNKHVFVAAAASLICIVTASLFSYPLQTFPILLQVTICLALVNSYHSDATNVVLPKVIAKGLKRVLLLLCSLLLIHSYILLQYKIRSHQAFELSRIGYRKKAVTFYKPLVYSYIKDGNTLYFYARDLYHSNELEKANLMLRKARKYFCTNEVYRLSASTAFELHNIQEAENLYKTALYMVPNRMVSRYDLLNFYSAMKDTTNAMYWATSIVTMEVKVPSKKTFRMQQRAATMLQSLQRR
ncbi:MAG: O-antigen ligase family protein, partial [Bacteroidota bacterium]|nr:O-antigen ligase family protein [Bacteroidota bacterium]